MTEYITYEMFGAVGDGKADDCFDNWFHVVLSFRSFGSEQ